MRYFLISLGVVLLIIFGIVIINRDSTKTAAPIGKKAVNLMDYATNTNASVQYSVEGPINALENHRTTSITVSPNSRTITVNTGYQGQALKSQTLGNDTNAYKAFLAALNRAGFTRERRVSVANPESICPIGSRTHYLVVEGSKDLMNLWSASCTTGSFGGSASLTGTLFQTQIPNYSSFVNSAK